MCEVVVRDPNPGGLSSADIGQALGLQVLAAVAADRGLDQRLERGEAPGARAHTPLGRAGAGILAEVLRVSGLVDRVRPALGHRRMDPHGRVGDRGIEGRRDGPARDRDRGGRGVAAHRDLGVGRTSSRWSATRGRLMSWSTVTNRSGRMLGRGWNSQGCASPTRRPCAGSPSAWRRTLGEDSTTACPSWMRGYPTGSGYTRSSRR